jgi:hypothetical protein
MNESNRQAWLRLIAQWCERRGFVSAESMMRDGPYIEDEAERFEAWAVESLFVALTDYDPGVRVRALVQVAEYRGRLGGGSPSDTWSWFGDAVSEAKEDIVDAVRKFHGEDHAAHVHTWRASRASDRLCRVEWIGCDGKPTPHNALAIGYAVHRDGQRYPVCREHWERAARGGSGATSYHHNEDCPGHPCRPSPAWTFEQCVHSLVWSFAPFDREEERSRPLAKGTPTSVVVAEKKGVA